MNQANSLSAESASSLLEMARKIEAKDPYTAGHTWRVANYGQILAAALEYDPEKVEAMFLAGTLHDIGKIAVPGEILTKPSRLTEEEFAILKKHPEDGHGILKDFDEFAAVLDVVLMHHEAIDGSGYPFGLAGDQIPHEARLFAVVDAFDAMTTTRCYRPAMPTDNALYELWRNRGRQFDPHIAEVFQGLVREGLLEHILGCHDFGVKVGTCPNCGPVLKIPDDAHFNDQVVCDSCHSRFTIAGLAAGEVRLEYAGSACPEDNIPAQPLP